MAITPLPPAPLPSDSTSEFNSKAFAFVAALDPMVTQINAELPTIDAAADASAAAVAAANFKGEWSTLTGALAIPASVSHNGSVWVLTQSLADVTSNEPGVDSPNYWISVTLPSAGASGNLLTSNGTEWQSVASPVPSPGTSGNVLTSNGTAWTSAPVSAGPKAADVQSFDSSGTWTKPSGFGAKSRVYIQAWGGGGSGKKGSSSYASGAGGGGYNERWVPLSSLGATVSATVGAGGTSVTSSGVNGNTGGTTSFGSVISAYGGAGGHDYGGGGGGQLSAGSATVAGGPLSRSNASTVGFEGNGSTLTRGAMEGITKGGGGGWIAFTCCSTQSLNAAGSLWGGGGGGHSGGGAGGASAFAGNGGAGGSTGTAGTQPGGGGGGSTSGNSGAGGAGRLIITVFDGA